MALEYNIDMDKPGLDGDEGGESSVRVRSGCGLFSYVLMGARASSLWYFSLSGLPESLYDPICPSRSCKACAYEYYVSQRDRLVLVSGCGRGRGRRFLVDDKDC